MMRIGILTFYYAENFGACLQAYALQTFLMRKGHFVEFINYKNSAIERTYQIFNPSNIWQRRNVFAGALEYLKRFKTLKNRLAKKKVYHQFVYEYLNVREGRYSSQMLSNYDALVVGSDQVWNLSITHGFDQNYFLDYQCVLDKIKISYAASSEEKAFRYFSLYEKRIARCLSSFKAISVRENVLKEELSKFTEKNISVCVDPVFLLQKKDYVKIEIPPPEKDYILVYHLFPTEEGVKLAEKLAQERQLKIIEIHAGFVKVIDHNRHKQNVGPLEMIGYINHAHMVITTSFHGSALSLILNKPLVVMNQGAITRIQNLLKMAGIENVLLNNADEFNDYNIDYNHVQEKLSDLIESSKDFLRDNLL